MDSYLTVEGQTQIEITVKRSKFIADISHVTSYDEAVSHVNGIKKKFSDATHNCYAFISDNKGTEMKFSDDGEPQGTAGQPILEVLRKSCLYNTAIVVTRYFGGIKLGTGGLSSAYTASAVSAANAAQKVNMVMSEQYILNADYSHIAALNSIITSSGGIILSSEYDKSVSILAAIPTDFCEIFLRDIKDATAGKVTIGSKGAKYIPYKARL